MTDKPEMTYVVWPHPRSAGLAFKSAERYRTHYRRADLPRPEDAARIAELEAALAPFADFADLMDFETEGFSADDVFRLIMRDDEGGVEYEPQQMRLGLFQAARSALKGGEG